MIVTLTPNPSVDRALDVDALHECAHRPVAGGRLEREDATCRGGRRPGRGGVL